MNYFCLVVGRVCIVDLYTLFSVCSLGLFLFTPEIAVLFIMTGRRRVCRRVEAVADKPIGLSSRTQIALWLLVVSTVIPRVHLCCKP